MGVNVFFYAVKKIAERLGNHFDAEIIEAHHAFKKDSPGGTAMHLIDLLEEAYGWSPEETTVMHGRQGIVGPRKPKEIGVHAIRAGGIIGEHTVLFSSPHERIEITQRSHSRESFVQGALIGAKWLLNQPIGLYNMEAVLGLS
jgi:4-hydroxy-tetrahydrodipicolinate reductase